MTKRRTVAIDIRLASYRRGGIRRYDIELARRLPTVAPDLDFTFVVGAEAPRIPRGSTRRSRIPAHFRFERWALGLELSRNVPDLFHSPDFVVPHLRSRRVATIHDLAFIQWPGLLSPDSRRYYAQVRASSAAADRIIAVSEYTARQIVSRLGVPDSRVVVVYNGVNLQHDVPAAEPAAVVAAELGQPVREFVSREVPLVLAVGTVEPRKRLDLLLAAMNEPNLTDMSLLVVGQPGWLADSAIARIRGAVDRGRALWLQDVSDQALAALYRLATLLALPSLDEGFGLTALEAMAAGLPVVAARAGALPEVIGDAGVLVDEPEPEAWSAALRSLVDDPEGRQRLARSGRDWAARFSWDETARQTARVYREVLG